MPVNKRCFIDTNVWLYALIESKENERKKTAKELIEAPDVFVSVQVINEVCVNLIKKAGFGETQISALVESF